MLWGLLTAVFVSAFSCLMMLIGFIDAVIEHGLSSTQARTFLLAAPAIVLAYLSASILWGAGVYALHRFRHSWRGWFLSGMWSGVVVGGTIGLTCALLYTWGGVNIIGYESLDDAWSSLAWMTAAFGVLSGIWAVFYVRPNHG